MLEKLRKNKVKILIGIAISETILVILMDRKLKIVNKEKNILEGKNKNLEDMNCGLTREIKNLAYQLGKKKNNK